MKFTKPSALHSMGATFQQLQEYADELNKYLKGNPPKQAPKAPEAKKNNGDDPEKKNKSKKKKEEPKE